MAEAQRPRVTYVTGTIFTEDGERREFALTPLASWQQWGNLRERLGDSVEAVTAMQEALEQAELFVGEDFDG